MIDKPKLSVRITALNLVEGETELRSKTYDKSNGLMSLSVSGVSNDAPYYGIISRAGSIEIVDKPDIIENDDGSTSVEYWLQKQSDDNVLPDVSIDIFINGSLQYSFTSNNEISYTIQDRKVTIELSDEINFLQDKEIGYDSVYENINALSILSDLTSMIGISVIVDDDTTEYLKKIVIPTNIILDQDFSTFDPISPRLIIQNDTCWNIMQQFAYAVRAIFYKLGDSYHLTRMRE